MALKSKDIQNYIEIQLSQIKTDTPIPFDLYYYFRMNNHIIIFRAAGESPSQELIERLKSRGIQSLWLYRDDQNLFQEYLNPPVVQTNEPSLSEVSPAVGAPPPEQPVQATPLEKSPNEIAPKTEEAAQAAEPKAEKTSESSESAAEGDHSDLPAEKRKLTVEIKVDKQAKKKREIKFEPEEEASHSKRAKQAAEKSQSDHASQDDHATRGEKSEIHQTSLAPSTQLLQLVVEQENHKNKLKELMKPQELGKKEKAILAKTARTVLKQAMEPTEIEPQNRTHTAAKKIVKDVLDEVNPQTESMIEEIWRKAETDGEFSHSTNVATYAVLLAIAFGNTDRNLISDLALAGLLHDVGLTQVPLNITLLSWKQHNARQSEFYSKHVEAGLELIDAFGPAVTPRVKSLIQQHHEKFDGTGYPQHLQGFKLDGVAQLLAIAELVDTIASGQWDGKKRTYSEALGTLEELEKARTFPEYFHPEILAAVLRWTRETSRDETQAALAAVNKQTRGLMRKVG